jgi:hypothetical protein
MASVKERLQSWGRGAWRFVSGAPLTYSWLTALLVTTIIHRDFLTKREYHTLILDSSTNIRQLFRRDQLEVLFYSLLWIDGRFWAPYLVLFTLFLAPAEHWLGQLRWLTVGLTAHVGATYISEGLLFLAIRYHDAPHKLMHARDIGVSYFLVGVIAVLAYRIASPWRWGYLAILIVIFAIPLARVDVNGLDFTAIGHFTAIFIGLCFYPMARHRDGRPIDPARLLRFASR